MEIRVLRYFLAVAREGNITSAANYGELSSFDAAHFVQADPGPGRGTGPATFDKKKPPGRADPGRDAISQAGGGDRLHGG